MNGPLAFFLVCYIVFLVATVFLAAPGDLERAGPAALVLPGILAGLVVALVYAARYLWKNGL